MTIRIGKKTIDPDNPQTEDLDPELEEQTDAGDESPSEFDFDSMLSASSSYDGDFVEFDGDDEDGQRINTSSQKNLALQLIANIIHVGDVKTLHEYTPPKGALSQGDLDLFNCLGSYAKKYRTLPSIEDLESFCKAEGVEFFGLPAADETTTTGYLYDQVMVNAQDERLTGYIKKALIARDEGETPLNRTKDLMHDLTRVLRLDPEVSKSNPIAKAVQVGIRHKQKLLKKSSQGVPFGLPTFDRETGGWGENTVNIIAARPSIGKTFMALKAALSAFKEGKRVKVFSAEMTEEQLWNRFFSMLAGIESNKISKFGLSTNEAKHLQAVIEDFTELVESGDYYIDMRHPSGKFTPVDIHQECMRDEIEFLVVDAAYLVQHENDYLNTKTWDKIREVINQIKLDIASPLKIPVVATYQLIDDVDKYTDPDQITLGDLYGGDTMAQIASTVMALWQDPSKTDPRLYMKILKGRDGEANLRGLWINWIFETMLFDEWEETTDLKDVEL
ncbi:DNA helicase [Vibrio phage vB_VpaS_VP-RY-9]|nr:DNA helicase [Vibrio phage vB_VpaS_VP-RY-9]